MKERTSVIIAAILIAAIALGTYFYGHMKYLENNTDTDTDIDVEPIPASDYPGDVPVTATYIGNIRYTIDNDGNYEFFTEDLTLLLSEDISLETVDETFLEEKGINVDYSSGNDIGEAEFTFTKGNEIYSASGRPYATITLSDDFTVTRPPIEARNIGWVVLENGRQVLDRNAANEYSYQYFGNTSGNTYEIYLNGFYDGMYVPISNTVTYTVP